MFCQTKKIFSYGFVMYALNSDPDCASKPGFRIISLSELKIDSFDEGII